MKQQGLSILRLTQYMLRKVMKERDKLRIERDKLQEDVMQSMQSERRTWKFLLTREWKKGG